VRGASDVPVCHSPLNMVRKSRFFVHQFTARLSECSWVQNLFKRLEDRITASPGTWFFTFWLTEASYSILGLEKCTSVLKPQEKYPAVPYSPEYNASFCKGVYESKGV